MTAAWVPMTPPPPCIRCIKGFVSDTSDGSLHPSLFVAAAAAAARSVCSRCSASNAAVDSAGDDTPLTPPLTPPLTGYPPPPIRAYAMSSCVIFAGVPGPAALPRLKLLLALVLVCARLDAA